MLVLRKVAQKAQLHPRQDVTKAIEKAVHFTCSCIFVFADYLFQRISGSFCDKGG
jgi:hypothetical protein